MLLPDAVDNDTLCQAYGRMFAGVSRQDFEIVMTDLARFCRAFGSTFTPDARAHALLEGRREVFFHIFERAELSGQQLAMIYLQRKLQNDRRSGSAPSRQPEPGDIFRGA